MGRVFYAAALIAAFVVASAPLGTRADDTAGVSAERLAAADTDANNWISYGRDLGAHRYSPLTSINKANVAQLKVAWTRNLGTPVSMEGTPTVVDGVLYATTGKSTIYAFDAATGKQIWKYVYPFPANAGPEACCNLNNRGVTPYKDMVVTETLDAHLVALDAKTGAVRWNTKVAPYLDGYTITSPPLAVKNLLLTGVGGGEYGIRGFVAAFDGDTGKLVWKTYVIPAPGQPGSETWKVPGSISRAGGSTWIQGTYDPELDTVYWGVGNPTPLFDPTANAGKLLYTDSTVALDPATGKMKWYFQYTQHDIWDYDGVNEPVLVDLPIGGTTVKAFAQSNRNGHLYLINRETGKVIWAKPFVDKVNYGTVDPKTGIATYSASQQATANAMHPFLACPGNMGGKNWEPTAYDPEKHLLFIPVIESCDKIVPAHTAFKKGALDLGGGLAMAAYIIHGSVAAWDLTTGKQVWKTHFRSPQIGGALATAGGLVFSSDPEGLLRAFDEDTGKVLWSFKAPTAINAPAISYAVGGKQYIAVLAGKGGAWPLFFAPSTPWLTPIPNGAKIYVFSVPGATAMR
jgi:alcohol dehydrogenase (cytochrome c)